MDDTVDHFNASRGTDAAGRAFSARLDRTELHRIPRHLGHVDGVVEYDDAAMAHQRANVSERLIVERCIELGLGHECAQRTANLNGPDRTTRRAPAPIVVQEFAQREPECLLDETAALDISTQLDRESSPSAAAAKRSRVSAHLC